MIDFYNYQATAFAEANAGRKKPMLPKDFVDTNPTKISWSRGLYADVGQGKQYKFNADRVFTSMYRPFSKQAAYFDRAFNDMVYKMDALFPFDGAENLVFPVTGRGSTKEFSTLMTNVLPDLELISKGQCFPLYYYEPVKNGAKRGLFNATDESMPLTKLLRTVSSVRTPSPMRPWGATGGITVTRASQRLTSSTTCMDCCTARSTVSGSKLTLRKLCRASRSLRTSTRSRPRGTSSLTCT